jgi:DNA-damage-inducible protein D
MGDLSKITDRLFGDGVERVSEPKPSRQIRVDREKIARMKATFEDAAQELDGVQVWLARDLQKLLGYTDWRNFTNVISKAKESCERAGAPVEDHFVDVTRMIEIGKGAQQRVADVALTRYACYLIAQNGDPQKSPVAFAQTYFALQTRKQEVLEERIAERERLIAREKLSHTENELSGVIYERGVDERGFGIIRSKGDAALFGGFTTLDMKRRLGVPQARALADFLPTVTIKAKDLAAEMTNYTVKSSNLRGEQRISHQHVENNRNVRSALVSSSIVPESLPPEEDIRKVERRLKSQEKTLPKETTGIPRIEYDAGGDGQAT